ncbi:MAG TPA: helix-turn-helix transcriptional regulator [Thermodesulfovibrionales bacterium]|nr:helix-turn-helix transcriptional regulator [Thermodesulfovibrionales bacterium]
MSEKILPNGKIRIENAVDLGRFVHDKRNKDGLTQAETAALCGVGTRFISDLENGKVTVELGKTLQVLKGLGIECLIGPRGWSGL